MEPQKARNGSPSRGSARHDSTTSSSNFTHSGFTSQPSLPSIRQLHPYLPPSGLSQHLGEGPSIMYSLPQSSSPVQSILGSRKSSEILAIDSEPDVVEQSCEPPKKKRRRQALSCTGPSLVPLVHAEESSRDVNGIEKYVTRAEFDDLKARYDELFEQVQRLQAGTPAPSFNHMGMPTGLPGAVGEAVPTTSPLGYPPIISPSQPLNPSTEIQSSQRFMKPEDTQPQSRQHLNTVATSLALTRSPPSVRQPPSDHSPTSPTIKKLLRADARAGEASAPRISGFIRPSGLLFRDDSPNLPSITGASSGPYLDNITSASQTNSANQTYPPSRRFMEPPLQAGLLSRDDSKEPLAHFARDR
ncbi:hypothetical protein C0993_006039 [Termitomyces sp. T159_Od127]|nr:hypothetical protein C0993_006039 [Termitomyces sp. T159_Od127]